jgi:hypothetical protein
MRGTTNLFIDIDGRTKADFPGMCNTLCKCGVQPLQLRGKRSPSGKGYHVVIRVRGTFSKFAIIALQLLCGSDAMREAQNFRRGQLAPKEWGEKWNVLYKK